MKKLMKSFLRPPYKLFVEPPLWWFLSRAKSYFFAEIGVQLGNMEQHMIRDNSLERLAALETQIRTLEKNLVTQNAAQWDAIEQLLIALYRQPLAESTPSDEVSDTVAPPEAGSLYRAHAASNLH
jgi:hypothetical protein